MSITATQVARLQYVKNKIIKDNKLTAEQYENIRFEIGCLFAERAGEGNADAILQIQTNASWGFWKWWKTQYALDDELIAQSTAVSHLSYEEKKRCMIGDSVITARFFDFINTIPE